MELSLVLIRIQLHESAGNAQAYAELPLQKRIVFCAFPENAPFIFWNAGVRDPLRAILLDVQTPQLLTELSRTKTFIVTSTCYVSTKATIRTEVNCPDSKVPYNYSAYEEFLKERTRTWSMEFIR